MTTTARRVLADARYALIQLDQAQPGQDLRVKWVGAVALLRAIGHVLHKVDATENEAMAEAVVDAWKRWNREPRKNSIFWTFIDAERNNILKEYAVGYSEGPVLVIVDEEEFELDEGLFAPLVDGPNEGQDIRDVYFNALSWWERELDLIDEQARKGHGPD